jgi:hypothetical protein
MLKTDVNQQKVIETIDINQQKVIERPTKGNNKPTKGNNNKKNERPSNPGAMRV